MFYAYLSIISPQGNFKESVRGRGRVQPRRRAAGAVSSETTAEHVRNYASIHAVQGGSRQHGQRGKEGGNHCWYLQHSAVWPSQKQMKRRSRNAQKGLEMYYVTLRGFFFNLCVCCNLPTVTEITWRSVRKTERENKQETVYKAIKAFKCSCLSSDCVVSQG